MEQNIEDILRQLKDSVSTEQEPAFEPKSTKKQADITTEALQAKLKDQYVFDATEVVKEEDLHSEPRGEYVLVVEGKTKKIANKCCFFFQKMQ